MHRANGFTAARLDIMYMDPADSMNPMDLLTDAGLGLLGMHMRRNIVCFISGDLLDGTLVLCIYDGSHPMVSM